MRNVPSRGLRILFAVAIGIQLVATAPAKSETFVYRQICDASAAVAIDADRFVVADDERNTLRIYRRDLADPLDGPIDLSAFLGTEPGKESDLEGAAAIGNRIYWVSSHGRNKQGKVQERRWRFFATEVTAEANPPVKVVGTPYKHLLEDLLASPQLKDYRLEEAAKLAPEAEGGLNIEGLAATPAGGLLIGFRNPIRHGKALIVPLNNPAGAVEGARAELGDPIELDLEGRGIRSIELVGTTYLVIAGPSGDVGSFALFRWAGDRADPEPLSAFLPENLNPEAIFEIQGTSKIQVLSDDGDVETDGVKCTERNDSEKKFRSIVLDIDDE